MTTDRLDLSALRNAITSLEDGIGVVRDEGWFALQSAAVRNTLVAGVIQNFELVYELGFKMLKRQIEAEAANPSEVDEFGFRDLLRVAAEKGLITDVEAWFVYRKMRGTTSRVYSHAYDHDKARLVYQGVLRFLDDARALLAALVTRNA